MRRGQGTGAASPRSGDRPNASGERVRLAPLLVGIVVVLASAAVAGPAGAVTADGQFAHGDSSDDQPPTIANAERVNDTAIRLTIADNHDVDESTISLGQFATEAGSITNVTATENGSNATVVLTLSAPVDENNLTVGAIGNTGISDTNGNVLGEDDSRTTVVVRNMDGVEPRVFSFSATDALGGPARLSFEASEALRSFNVSVRGAVADELDESDFARDGSGFTYTTTYTPAADGTVRFALYRYTDTAGNTRTLSIKRSISVDLTPPEARAGLDLGASANLSLVFDGGQSTDANGVANYTWDFGDGTTATGERVTHVFDPGEYTVTMEAIDPAGNVGTDTIPLNLSTGAGNVTDVDATLREQRLGTNVTVQRAPDSAGTDAVVTVERARAGVPIQIAGGDDRPLASVGNVSLDGLNVTLTTNRSLDLGVSMAGPGAVGDAAAATETESLAGITVVHAVPSSAVAEATFSLRVNESRLDELGVEPANVTVFRFHNGSWNELPTTERTASNGTAIDNGTVRFTARSPGFSRFALGATPTGDSAADSPAVPSFSVSEVTLGGSTLQVGDRLTATVSVVNDGTAAGTYTAGLALNGSVVATATSASIPPGESGSVEIQHTVQRAGTRSVTVNDTAAGTLTVEPAAGDTETETASDRTNGADGPQFVVTNVTLNRTETAPGGAVLVNATVRNRGPNPGVYTAGLAVNGGLVATEPSAPIPDNASRTVGIPYRFNDTGEFSLSVNATTGGTVTVRSGGGLLAPLFGVLAALPIPMGILQPLVTFVLAPLFVIWAILKALAIYLGY